MYYINSATHVYKNERNEEIVAFFDADPSYDLHFVLGWNVMLVIKPQEMSESYIDFFSTQDYEDEIEVYERLVKATKFWSKIDENKSAKVARGKSRSVTIGGDVINTTIVTGDDRGGGT